MNKEILASLSNVNSLVKVIMTLAAAQEGDRSEEAGEEHGEEDDQREDGDESGKLGEAGECCHLEDNDQPSPTTSEKSGGRFICGVFRDKNGTGVRIVFITLYICRTLRSALCHSSRMNDQWSGDLALLYLNNFIYVHFS